MHRTAAAREKRPLVGVALAIGCGAGYVAFAAGLPQDPSILAGLVVTAFTVLLILLAPTSVPDEPRRTVPGDGAGGDE